MDKSPITNEVLIKFVEWAIAPAPSKPVIDDMVNEPISGARDKPVPEGLDRPETAVKLLFSDGIPWLPFIWTSLSMCSGAHSSFGSETFTVVEVQHEKVVELK